MKRVQISHNVIDEKILKEVKKYMITSWQKYLLIVTGLVAVILGIVNLMHQETVQGVIFVVLGVVCIGEIFFLIQSRYKEMMKLITEEGENKQITYTMSFGNDYVVVHNCQTAIDNKIPYHYIRTISQTPHAYILLAKKNEMIIIRKDCLKGNVKDFIDFLKSKDTKIKKWLKD